MAGRGLGSGLGGKGRRILVEMIDETRQRRELETSSPNMIELVEKSVSSSIGNM